MTRRPSITAVKERVARMYGVDIETLHWEGKAPGPLTHIRDVALYCAHQTTMHSTTSIGEHFGGMHSSLVSDGVRRIREQIAGDRILADNVTGIIAGLAPDFREKEYAR